MAASHFQVHAMLSIVVGSIAQWLAYLHAGSAALDSIPSVPKFCSKGKIVNVAKVYQWHCFEESGQWL